jgi:UTP--glucose-1-phosphate uridylyltransferase
LTHGDSFDRLTAAISTKECAVEIKKAIITAAGRNQHTLPLQTLVDRDGTPKAALRIIIEEALRAGVDSICLVINPGSQAAYAAAAGEHADRLEFVEQAQPLGYGHAVWCARKFVGNAPFLLLVGDHLYVSRGPKTCAQQLVEVARSESCSVSAVQSTHESKLPFYGTIGGRLVAGRQRLYQVENVVEKPAPTQAEQELIVPGLRAGHYLCFFGMHVLTPAVMEILGKMVKTAGPAGGLHLSAALATLALQEKYLAYEARGWRYDIGLKYGLLTAQLALALDGQDREEVLAGLVELLALRAE